MAFTLSPNMLLPVPNVGTEPGPQYASDVNTALSLIDTHDHSPGKGVPITTAGFTVDQNLNFNNRTAFNMEAATFLTQTVAPALQSIYVKAAGTSPIINELWYIDSAGQQVQLTSNGIVNVTASSITGVTYNSGTFTFTQAQDALPTTPASLSAGNVTLKPIVAATPYSVTLTPPSGIASQYNIAMPLLPLAQSFMTIDQSGNEAAPIAFSHGITEANIAPLTLTGASIANQTLDATKLVVNSAVISSGAPYVIPQTNLNVILSAGGGAFSAEMPSPGGIGGREFTLKKADGSLNTITLSTASGVFADPGAITPILATPGEVWKFVSDGTNWQVTEHKTLSPYLNYAPTITGWSTAITGISVFSRRNGKNLEVFGAFTSGNTSGTVVNLTIGFNGSNTPSGVAIDSSLISSTINSYIGNWASENGVQFGPVFTNTNGSQILVYLGILGTAAAGLTVASGTQIGGNSRIRFSFTVPIAAWND
jgi:hypothetical protein